MKKTKLKRRVCQVIEEHKEEIFEINQQIYDYPELGYKESFATELIAEQLADLGLEVERDFALTGCKATIASREVGPKVAVLGELDAVICKEHPDAKQKTGAVHACGHNIQLATMLAVAIGLTTTEVIENLAGSVEFMATPAEEYVELEYRGELAREKKIKFFGGKQELIYRGEFDDVDLAMMIHSLDLGANKALIGGTGNGFIGKKVKFIGQESHAGSAPEEGVNALNAAMLAISNINAQRETFADQDRIRVHPIITKGGDMVNVVPADVRMETYVRGRTIDSILDANQKVDRALQAGAMAVGAEVEISDLPGYLPLLNNEALDQLFVDNLTEFIPQDTIQYGSDFSGSFDFGDLSHLIPTLHPFFAGVSGALHTRDFSLEDRELAIITPAKAMATTIIDLLFDQASLAEEIITNFEPTMSKEEYLDLQRKISNE
ncbi:amidohydrolase [Natroniella sulfidigena]|uniref:amidohydrolase n=1 Tax=Natroniella sulfidigena TaxID=723921 RepID=UPI002009DC89|nr:amidohydrolase [Natroniella sulfidigena]MCK8817268.1 amidohydrolase [Natroniella sulfidigena]